MEPLFAAAALLIIGYMAGSVRIIEEGDAGIVQRLGRFRRTLQPGLNFVIPVLDSVLVETTKEQLLDIPPQPGTTKDGVSLQVDAIVSWKILDVQRAFYRVENLQESLKQIVITTLRSQVANLDLMDVLTAREKIKKELLKVLDKETESWGVEVLRVELQNITISEEVRQALELERAARSMKNADIEKAKGQVESIHILTEALQSDPNAMAVLRYLLTKDYVDVNSQLSQSANSKIIFMDPRALTETIGELIGADTTEGIDFSNSGSSGQSKG